MKLMIDDTVNQKPFSLPFYFSPTGWSIIAFSPIKMVEASKLKIDLHSLTFKLLKGEKNVTTKWCSL